MKEIGWIEEIEEIEEITIRMDSSAFLRVIARFQRVLLDILEKQHREVPREERLRLLAEEILRISFPGSAALRVAELPALYARLQEVDAAERKSLGMTGTRELVGTPH